MARGKSGRIVLEIDPDLKRRLYSALESQQQTMKDWFVKEAQSVVYGAKESSAEPDTDIEKDSGTADGGAD